MVTMVEAFTLLSGGNSNYNVPLTKNFLIHGLNNKYPDWKTLSTCNGLSNNDVSYEMKDSKGNMWITTYGGSGIAKMDSTGKWTTFNSKNGLAYNYANGLLEDKNGNIWACFGSDSGMVAKYNGTSWTTPNAGNIHTLTAFQDSKGYNWFGTWGYGVRKYDVANNILTTYNTENSGLAADIVWYGGIMEDKSGNIWIGTTTWGGSVGGTGGLCKFDGTNWTVYNTSNSGIPENVYCLFADGF